MIFPQHILKSLQQKEDEFIAFQNQTDTERQQYAEWFTVFAQEPEAAVQTRLGFHEWSGAYPTDERFEQESPYKAFSHRFSNHQEAREWAAQILEGTTTFAVDGSQLMPNKEVSVPTALVQVGWFLNPHQKGKAFEKQTYTEVIGPRELLSSGSEDKMFHDQYISLKRYQLETRKMEHFLERYTHIEPVSLGFFDGSLLISFAEVLMDVHRNAYLDAATSLLERSYQTTVPIVGYIDTSLARDLVKMLSLYFFNETPSKQDGIRDTDLVDSLLPAWGDRTIAFKLKRKGILKHYEDVGGGLGFVYLRTAMDRPPARVEFPYWLVEAGILEHVLNLLRAELIVGNGYPYAIETADEIACFQPRDRALFASLLQSFLKERQLECSIASKRRSKQRRRQ